MRFTARHLFRGLGRHRAARIPGQLARQRFVHCPACAATTTATIHGTLVRCAEGHHVTGGNQ
ncbi:hypothetical protein [Streptomyces flaveolus]|uniref:hypothetical protein n=1 Tax=Streptomyces flaveolus TaxID=67297 RepID=UPI001670766F|nr:hypothetical protein [Streptomyces flaveolus]GGQ83433.1 hypothetical protein GCM10010216_51570 [Streptomyces flaveolus]